MSKKFLCKHCGANLVDDLAYDQITPNYFNADHQIEMGEPKEITRYYCLACEHTIRYDYGSKILDYILENF